MAGVSTSLEIISSGNDVAGLRGDWMVNWHGKASNFPRLGRVSKFLYPTCTTEAQLAHRAVGLSSLARRETAEWRRMVRGPRGTDAPAAVPTHHQCIAWPTCRQTQVEKGRTPSRASAGSEGAGRTVLRSTEGGSARALPAVPERTSPDSRVRARPSRIVMESVSPIASHRSSRTTPMHVALRE